MYSAIPIPAFEQDFRNQLKPCDDAKSQLFSYDFLLSEKFIKKKRANQNTCMILEAKRRPVSSEDNFFGTASI